MMRHTSADMLIGTTLGTYRLEALLSQSDLGWLFAARNTQPPLTAHLARVLAVPPIANAGARTIFHDQFHIQASHLATLQHPYLLPLIGYGIANVMPYVVWPAVATRSLTARLASSGPLDVLTVGRYVDQVAAALEYAHEHATLHGGLSTDCLYLQPDGHLVVGDLGVRLLVELGLKPQPSRVLLGNSEACAPEQVLGGPVSPATDVYALGAVIYRLLAGVSVFGGPTLEAITRDHLRAPVPALSRVRAGLPPALDQLLATALAKDPAQRFTQPGALANAYHAIVAPAQTSRMPFVASGPSAAGAWRTSAVLANGGTPSSADTWADARARTSQPGVAVTTDPGWGSAAAVGTRVPRARAPLMAPLGGAAPAAVPGRGAPPEVLQSLPRRPGRLGRNLLFGALVLVVLAGGTFGLTRLTGVFTRGSGATGVVLFTDRPQSPPGHTDAVRIVVHNLATPPTSEFYDAWLIDSASEHVTPLGTLVVQDGEYQLVDSGDALSTAPGANLLAAGDRVEITLEQGSVKLPVGQVELSGAFPPESFVHIRHLLVSFPTTPGQTALVVGVLGQTQLLDAQAKVLASVAAGQNPAAIQCAAQSMVDILEGKQGAHFRSPGGTCAALNITATGDGFGLLGSGAYLSEAAQHASNAAIAPDATSFIRTHAGHVEIAITNIQGWLAQVEQQSLALMANPSATSEVPRIVALTDRAVNGADTNGDEQVDPVVGEAGAVTAYDHAQLMATLNLLAAA